MIFKTFVGIVLAVAAAAGSIVQAQENSNVARCGSIVIDGSAFLNDITVQQAVCGIPPDVLESLIRDKTRDLTNINDNQQKVIETLQEKLNLNLRQLAYVLRTLGEKDIPSDEYTTKLIEIAERFKTLERAFGVSPSVDARVDEIRENALRAIREGKLEEADSLLAGVQSVQAVAIMRLDEALAKQASQVELYKLDAAATIARRGEIALTGLRYSEAAQYFADAVARLPESRQNIRLRYLEQQANALLLQANVFADRASAQKATELIEQVLTQLPRDRIHWGKVQHSYGDALSALGVLESGTARLIASVSAYQEALKDFESKLARREWARTQESLGAVLTRIAEREPGTKRLVDAVEAYNASLTERTRQRDPLGWANTQTNLGSALMLLGWREERPKRLVEAVDAYNAALSVYTRDSYPLSWAWATSSLGTTLALLGWQEKRTDRLQASIAALRAALEERSPERFPIAWAYTQNSLGIALGFLGWLSNDTKPLEDAVKAYDEALKKRIRDRVPFQWAASTGGQGVVFMLIAQHIGEVSIANTAVDNLDQAVKALQEGGDLSYLAFFQVQLSRARILAERLRKR